MIMIQMCQNTVKVELDLGIKHKISLNNNIKAIWYLNQSIIILTTNGHLKGVINLT